MYIVCFQLKKIYVNKPETKKKFMQVSRKFQDS